MPLQRPGTRVGPAWGPIDINGKQQQQHSQRVAGHPIQGAPEGSSSSAPETTDAVPQTKKPRGRRGAGTIKVARPTVRCGNLLIQCTIQEVQELLRAEVSHLPEQQTWSSRLTTLELRVTRLETLDAASETSDALQAWYNDKAEAKQTEQHKPEHQQQLEAIGSTTAQSQQEGVIEAAVADGSELLPLGMPEEHPADSSESQDGGTEGAACKVAADLGRCDDQADAGDGGACRCDGSHAEALDNDDDDKVDPIGGDAHVEGNDAHTDAGNAGQRIGFDTSCDKGHVSAGDDVAGDSNKFGRNDGDHAASVCCSEMSDKTKGDGKVGFAGGEAVRDVLGTPSQILDGEAADTVAGHADQFVSMPVTEFKERGRNRKRRSGKRNGCNGEPAEAILANLDVNVEHDGPQPEISAESSPKESELINLTRQVINLNLSNLNDDWPRIEEMKMMVKQCDNIHALEDIHETLGRFQEAEGLEDTIQLYRALETYLPARPRLPLYQVMLKQANGNTKGKGEGKAKRDGSRSH